MPALNPDLHGNVPDSSSVALLLIDVINDLEFPGGELLEPFALQAARKIAQLKQRAKSLDIPTVYVNDNFGRWQSDFRGVVDHCLQDGVRGQALCELLKPKDDDYFVLKPKHSGFYSTALDTLLDYLGARTLILAGFAGNICVLFTANDAYMRDFRLIIPEDCVASESETLNRQAVALMASILRADTRASEQLDMHAVRAGRDQMSGTARVLR